MLGLLSSIAVALVPLAAASPLDHRAVLSKKALIYDGASVSGRSYDYVVVGGGLAGSVLASRLSEDSKSVLVIEAGYDEEGRAGVTDASQYQSTFNTFLDWAYQTVPQNSADGKAATIRAGRALGGSTTINGLAWTKPHTFQIDALESLGNEGLNWASLQPFMLMAETGKAPSSSQSSAGMTWTPSCHGTSGPVRVQYSDDASPQAVERAFSSAVQGLGLPIVPDITCGNPAGAGIIGDTQLGNVRSNAYRAYLWQKNRPNLTILAGATVGRVLLSSDSTPRATGVEFKDENGRTYQVQAGREVILAAGSIKTPAILQYSGIGPKAALASAGVTQRVDLPVGMNLIDQTTCTSNFAFTGARGAGQVITFPRFQDLFSSSERSTMSSLLNDNMAAYAQDAVNNGASNNAGGLQKVLEIQRDWILNKGAAFSESFDYTYYNNGQSGVLGYDSWFLLPFARGSVKITSSDAYSGSLSIDPRYYSNAFDRLAQAATVRFTRTLSNTNQLAGIVTGESTPGGAVPSGANLDSWSNWSRANYRPNWHPIGTAPMMSRSLGGCVDSRNRVYGVNGLRVVDGSTLPMQVSAHLMSTLYGLAERAASLVKQDNAGTSPSSTRSSSTTSASRTSSSASRTSSTTSSAPPSSSGVAIHPNGDLTKCLDVQSANFADGSPVQLYDCNGSAAQKWIISRGSTKIQVAGRNFCLDAGANPGSGTAMKIWTCYSGLAAQQWTSSNSNTLSLGGQCLDLPNGSKANGNVLQTWACSNNGNQNQIWTF